jgi:hypothetical protein
MTEGHESEPTPTPTSTSTPSRAKQQRHLLPRRPPDWLVATLLAVGIAGFFVAGASDDSSLWFLLPGAVTAVVQKVNGHWAAWHSDGVERAFVLESTAMSFYVLTAFLLGAGILQGLGVLEVVNAAWGVIAALFLDSTVRGWAEHRYA